MFRRLPVLVLRRVRWRDGSQQLSRHPEPATRERERLAVQGGKPQQGREVRAGPQPVHVRLAATGLTAEKHPGQRPAIVDVDLGLVG